MSASAVVIHYEEARAISSVGLCTFTFMGVSRYISKTNGDFRRKSQFLLPRVLIPLRGFPLEFCTGGGAQKL